MKWFEDSIAEAVNVCKLRNSVFVVYVEGNDDLSRVMTLALDNADISDSLASDKFVSIKVIKGSESHQQFNEIYKLVPVPSVFFIGENGVPLEIVAGDNNEQDLIVKLKAAIRKSTGLSVENCATTGSTSSASPSAPPAASVAPSSISQSPSAPTNEMTTDSISTNTASNTSASENGNQKSPLNEQQLREIMANKRQEAQKLDEQKEKEREIARRRMGKELAMAKKAQQERVVEEARREREREKKEEALARERVLRQIEEDKAMRAAKLAKTTPSVPTAPQPETPSPSYSSKSDCARLQFKLPDGQARTNTFAATATIRDLRKFIDSEMQLPFSEYSLSTTFPRREFTSRDLDKDLASLQLTPSAVILIMPLVGAVVSSGPGWAAAFSALFWSLVKPLASLGQYIGSLVWGSPPPSETSGGSRRPLTPQQQQPSQQQGGSFDQPQPSFGPTRSVRKRGNVHSLHDADDSNDENNTWNGNSTQLM